LLFIGYIYVQNLKNRLLKIVIGWLVVVISLLAIFFVVNLIPAKIATESTVGVETTFLRLAEQRKYSSEFIASDNNLKRIDVLFKNPNLESRDELSILIKDDNSVIYQQTFTGFNFGDTSHARLDFIPVVDSFYKKYRLEIVATKIVDGKLYFGVKNKEIDMILYYYKRNTIFESVVKSVRLMQNWVLLLPLITVTLFLW